MKKDIIDIIEEKEFIELSSAERTELIDFCTTEEEYNQLKNVLSNVSGVKRVNPSPREETKESLDRLFDESFPRTVPMWQNTVLTVIIPRNKPLYMQPLLHVAAVALLLILVVPMFQNEIINKKTSIAKIDVTDSKQVEKPMEQDQKELTPYTETNPMPISVENETTTVTGLDRDEKDFSGLTIPEDDFSAAGSGFSETSVSDHPDGVFSARTDEKVAFSQPASESSDLLDLLTATF